MEYGNLAYKLEPRKQPIPPKKKQTQIKSKKKENAQMLYRKKTFIRIFYIVTVAFAASFMISKFVAVYETGQEIKTLQAKLNTMQSYTSQKIFEMEQRVDLTRIEQEATTRLGMQRPEKYQMIYVDVKQDDVTEVTAGEVEGVGKRVGAFWDKVKKNIIELFSIN